MLGSAGSNGSIHDFRQWLNSRGTGAHGTNDITWCLIVSLMRGVGPVCASLQPNFLLWVGVSEPLLCDAPHEKRQPVALKSVRQFVRDTNRRIKSQQPALNAALLIQLGGDMRKRPTEPNASNADKPPQSFHDFFRILYSAATRCPWGHEPSTSAWVSGSQATTLRQCGRRRGGPARRRGRRSAATRGQRRRSQERTSRGVLRRREVRSDRA